MFGKLTLLAGVGAGYVLGAKAGTQRYDQIMQQANQLLGRPEVQRATDKATAAASDLADTAKGKAKDTAGKAKDKVSSSSDEPPVAPYSVDGSSTLGTAPVVGAAPSDTL